MVSSYELVARFTVVTEFLGRKHGSARLLMPLAVINPFSDRADGSFTQAMPRALSRKLG